MTRAIVKSYLRAFLTILIAVAAYLQVAGEGKLSAAALLIVGGVVAVGPVALRALDSRDQEFGRGYVPQDPAFTKDGE